MLSLTSPTYAPPPHLIPVPLRPHMLPRITVLLTASETRYLTGDDTRLPCPSPSTPLLPGDARLAYRAHGEDFFSPPQPTLEASLGAAIATLGGAVFAKGCGVAPLDAAWSSTPGGGEEAMKCCSVGDIWSLLMASERVQTAMKRVGGQGPSLTLFQWISGIHREREVLCSFDTATTATSASSTSHIKAVKRHGGETISASLRSDLDDFLASLPLKALFPSSDDGSSNSTCTLHLYFSPEKSTPTILDFDLFTPTTVPAGEGVEKAAEEGVGGDSKGIHFHPYAAHAFPEEVFHYAAEKVAAVTVGGVGGSTDEVGGIISQLAKEHAAQGGLQGGWERLVEELHARGEFVKGGTEEEEGEEEDEEKEGKEKVK